MSTVRTFTRYRKIIMNQRTLSSQFSTSRLFQQSSVAKKSDHIILTDENNSSLEIAHMWLRDHCQCSKCYNHVTNQRELDLLSIDPKINPVKLETNKNILAIVWSDDHESIFDINWIFNRLSPTRRRPRGLQKILWNAEKIKSIGIPSVSYQELKQTFGLIKHLTNIVTYGFNCVVEAPPTVEATKDVCTRTGFIEQTYGGDVWLYSNENEDAADKSLTNAAIPVHTDSTYFTQTIGFQVFHCLEHDGFGGESLLVDGFQAIEELREQNNEAFRFLSTFRVPYHCTDKDLNTYVELPIIETKPDTGEILQLRFNVMDRGAMTNFTDLKSTNKFYDAYISLMKIIRRKENELHYKLRPGTVIVMDNFRVMHGRTAFTGKRVMAGSYLDRDDFYSRARVRGLL